MAGTKGVDLTLNDVLVVTGLTVSLFSVRVATKLGYEVMFRASRQPPKHAQVSRSYRGLPG